MKLGRFFSGSPRYGMRQRLPRSLRNLRPSISTSCPSTTRIPPVSPPSDDAAAALRVVSSTRAPVFAGLDGAPPGVASHAPPHFGTHLASSLAGAWRVPTWGAVTAGVLLRDTVTCRGPVAPAPDSQTCPPGQAKLSLDWVRPSLLSPSHVGTQRPAVDLRVWREPHSHLTGASGGVMLGHVPAFGSTCTHFMLLATSPPGHFTSAWHSTSAHLFAAHSGRARSSQWLSSTHSTHVPLPPPGAMLPRGLPRAYW